MSGTTAIEWTDRTWNPLTGCTKVSPGCDHCYAKTMHERFNGPGSFDTVTLHPERLRQPLRWRKPSMVFVNSMSDLFHKDVSDEFIAEVFAVMALAPHTFQILTKRPGRMRSLLNDPWWRDTLLPEMIDQAARPHDYSVWYPLPNVWLGVSVETQKWADVRIPLLFDTPAAVRFLSCEPLLGPVDLDEGEWLRCGNDTLGHQCHGCTIDWVIVGGESGPGARPMHPDWARTLRDQCVTARVPFLFKQWGNWATDGTLSAGHLSDPRERHGEVVIDGKYPEQTWWRLYRNVGKKAAGRILDGRTWDEYPAATA